MGSSDSPQVRPCHAHSSKRWWCLWACLHVVSPGCAWAPDLSYYCGWPQFLWAHSLCGCHLYFYVLSAQHFSWKVGFLRRKGWLKTTAYIEAGPAALRSLLKCLVFLLLSRSWARIYSPHMRSWSWTMCRLDPCPWSCVWWSPSLWVKPEETAVPRQPKYTFMFHVMSLRLSRDESQNRSSLFSRMLCVFFRLCLWVLVIRLKCGYAFILLTVWIWAHTFWMRYPCSFSGVKCLF